MLYCQKLHKNAKLPTVVHAGKDLGYDLYALEEKTISRFETAIVPTGIAAQFVKNDNLRYGFLIRDRSSMAVKGIFTVGGVIDADYTGQLAVIFFNSTNTSVTIAAGQKMAQMVVTPVFSSGIEEVSDLCSMEHNKQNQRGSNSFGSSGT